MYRDHSVICIAPVFDEEAKIREVVRRMPRDIVDDVLVVDDGSTDGSADAARDEGARVLSLGACRGVGAAIRAGYASALAQDFDIAVVIAGNNKDAPEEMAALLAPIADGEADVVQGSRYLSRHRDLGDMPTYRRVATRLHPLLFSAVARQHVTDSTNGYRAVHRRVLADPRLDLTPAWLDAYELEPYLLLSAIRLGFRVSEAPVSKVYPPRAQGQTKMKPLTDWWSILRPVVYLGLGIKD
jgi:dolichol-phosphate mannosyltransferase